ncbi:MAG: CrcB family protein [Lawsonella clevelandensis]
MGTTALLVMGGGALGALLRFILDRTLLSVQLDSAAKGKRVPAFSTGILLANLFGSFLLGLFTVALSVGVMSDNSYAIWGVGLCGAFTTFSTFSVEVVTDATHSPRLAGTVLRTGERTGWTVAGRTGRFPHPG